MRIFLLLALLASPSLAQEQVYRLSEADKRAAIDAAGRQPESNTRLPIVDGRAPGSTDKRVRSEVGMMVGTGGTRALYGSTAVPLGENGMAQFSFSTGRFNNFGGGFGYNQYADGSFPLTRGGSPFALGRNPYGLGGLGYGAFGGSPFGLSPF
ncbi:hypothetical protein GCM10007973_28750 [Polymorphobacter multimanifer]|uniref:Uncharacterized protein n=1 Tax=Polymorphobacter multimanifer TaxID=1070431 RepID=A0A841L1J5_9SPHN|nr:hypothetical protein [Polymorphobacter multimanifer]MBB6226537.1 hypothetical protein [Polymorphobacter multimanifer]GGI90667.1 hypothetical protein GCM10007973_28750 [Polymorphobacter multimanifer]